MKHILPALKLTLMSVVVFVVLYTILIRGIALLAPGNGKGETVSVNNRVVGYKMIGQSFTGANYFNSRPSATGYNAAGSGGSNKGPSNLDYLKQVQERIDTFLVHNPGVKKREIPAELVTASGSGLDPDISPEAAIVQVGRVAASRHLSNEKVTALVRQHIHPPLLGLFGTPTVNVLRLNIGLDQLK